MNNLQAILERGRAAAEGRNTETFTVYTLSRVLNKATGAHDEVENVAYSDVSGRVKYPTLDITEKPQGGQVPAVQDVRISVALGATPDVAVNHYWRCESSTVDPSLVGRVYRTTGAPQAGQVTANRYPVEEVS